MRSYCIPLVAIVSASVIGLGPLPTACNAEDKKPLIARSIERLDPALDELLPPDTKI
jgi:hypothetical protein